VGNVILLTYDNHFNVADAANIPVHPCIARTLPSFLVTDSALGRTDGETRVSPCP
jgi:hypothetical protein